MTTPYLFCLGLGYSALVLARQLKAEGWRVGGTCRSADKRIDLTAEGLEARLFADFSPSALVGVTHILVSIPPGPDGDPCLPSSLPDLKWLGYLSTTGVYGDRAGGWVDEGSPLRPTSERSRQRVEAERRWLALHYDRGLPVHVFRLAGIYGPGRSALDQVLEGTAQRIVKEGQMFSRIHVADIANVLKASMARPRPGAVYNVCDDEPAAPGEVIAYACALLGVNPPPEIPFAEAALSPMGRSFWADNKRVSNRRIKQELGVNLLYPTYQEGLQACLFSGQGR